MQYEVGNRVIVIERGRLSVGSVVEVSGDGEKPQYTVQFGEFRTVVYDHNNVLRYTAGRWDTLNNAMEAIFVGYRTEDHAGTAKARTPRTRSKAAVAD